MTSHQTQERRAFPLSAANAGEGDSLPNSPSSPAPLPRFTVKQLIAVWAFIAAVLFACFAAWFWGISLAVSGVIDWIERIAG